MSGPQIVCPKCRAKIRLTDTIAGPLLAKTRKLFEQQIARKEAGIAKHQAALRKARDSLAKARRDIDDQVSKRVQAQLVDIRDQVRSEVEDTHKARVVEKETQIAGMQRQIETLRRKAHQGSQQIQGEAFELQIKASLRQQFPQDALEPVRVGTSGGDILQRVRGPSGQVVGTILWECKQTRTWHDRWLGKLRDDQRAAKADIALIVSNALPKNIETCGVAGNVWISAPRFAIPLAIALRQSLIALSNSRQAAAGHNSRIEMIYSYLTGAQFRRHIGSIIETFADMQADLDRERRTTMRLWAKRESQLNAVISASANFYGDLQGIAGQSIPELESLSPLMIEDKSVTGHAKSDDHKSDHRSARVSDNRPRSG